jgi:molecular chaperone GrpE
MPDDKSRDNPPVLEAEEIELEAEGSPDLEAAMREAVEAVERAETQGGGLAAADGGAQSAGAEGDQIAEENDISMLQNELADLRDRSARTLADFDNYRKRIERERREERRFATLDLIREVLSVMDNLERALAAEGDADDLKVGVELILRQIHDLLRNHGVSKVPAVGEEFDPKLHDAVSRHEDPEVEVPRVSEELQAGFLMHDRLLRPAIVRVAMPANEDKAGKVEPGEPIH